MENTLSFSEFKNEHPSNHFLRDFDNEEEYQSLIAELTELTNGGDYESVYEFAQMEGCDMDDVYELIGR